MDTPTRGVLYVAYGDQAKFECGASLSTLLEHNPTIKAAVITDHTRAVGAIPNLVEAIIIPDDPNDPGARTKKLAGWHLSPFEHTLYLDADTRVHGSLAPLFELLDHWPMILTYSTRQGQDVLGNCSPEDRVATFAALGTHDVLGLQCGVMGYRTSDHRVHTLFNHWRIEWDRFQDRDQAAFLRALHHKPLPIYLVSRDFNGGAIVEHRYGHAARPRS